MEALQPILQPLLRIGRGLSRGQRIGLGVVAAALIGLLVIVSTVGHGPDSGVAYSGLSTDDEAAVVAKLKDAKITYELVDGGTIRVPTGQLEEAKLATAGMGLGNKPAAGTGFELFNQPSFGQTEFTQKVNYQRALETELTRSIDRMDSIDSATVHLVMPQPALFSSQQADTTASVMLKLKPGQHLDTAQARSISNLVASSVEGLKPANLTIIDVDGNTLTPDDGATTSTGLTSKQLDTQHGYEATTTRNLQTMLDRVLGTGKATVQVSALMNWDTSEQTNEVYSPTDPTTTPILTNHAISQSSTGGAGAAAGGVPGAASNNGAVPSYQGAAGTGGTTTNTDVSTAYQLNKSVQKVVRAPGAVTRLSVSVMLDDDPNNPNPPALQQSVQAAVNAAAGIDPARGDVLTVSSLAFNRQELLTNQAALADVNQKEQLMSYLHLGALVLGPLLLLLALFFIFSRGRGKSSEEKAALKEAKAAAKAAAKSLAKDGPAKVEEILAAAAVPAKTPGKPNSDVSQPIVEDPQKVYIREQIQMLGKSNPATVAQLIQTWMDEDRRN